MVWHTCLYNIICMHGVRCAFLCTGRLYIFELHMALHTGQLYIHGSCVLCIGILVAIIFTFIVHTYILAAYTCMDHVYMLCMLIHLSSVPV